MWKTTITQDLLLIIHTSDPFIEMERHNKTYGFTIAIKELRETVPNIFRYASAYKRVNNITSTGLWNMFVERPNAKQSETASLPKGKKPLPEEILNTEPGTGNLEEIDPNSMEGESYNMCHYWSNFEIARLDWFRSKEYNDFFEMMDRSGGFWMERVSTCLNLFGPQNTNILFSGVMLQFIHLPLVSFLIQRTFTISAILATDTLQFSIALPTLHLANYQDYPSLNHK